MFSSIRQNFIEIQIVEGLQTIVDVEAPIADERLKMAAIALSNTSFCCVIRSQTLRHDKRRKWGERKCVFLGHQKEISLVRVDRF